MIFVTVGAQMPFDRLIRAVDDWTMVHPDVEVFAQIGDGATPPRHCSYSARLTSLEFVSRVRASNLIVAHAGMGSILTALEYEKPILVLPRRGELRETRNDHQLATARRFADAGRVRVALNESEIGPLLDEFAAKPSAWQAQNSIGAFATPQLLGALRAFVQGGVAWAAASMVGPVPGCPR
ncbi:MAG: glycosyl transferase family 28 [Phycisphaerales bacterium]|nr:glycosyl transferase family 28 [Phycisphaerales bacterium]